MAVEIRVKLSEREAEAVLRAEFSVGHGVRRSQALQLAEFKLHSAIIRELRERDDAKPSEGEK